MQLVMEQTQAIHPYGDEGASSLMPQNATTPATEGRCAECARLLLTLGHRSTHTGRQPDTQA